MAWGFMHEPVTNCERKSRKELPGGQGYGVGFRVQGSGLRVQGSGYDIETLS